MAKLYFRYAAMNAGKSTALLQAAYNYESDLNRKILIFTAEIDKRFKEASVTSRLGVAHTAETFNASTNFINVVREKSSVTSEQRNIISCIFVDEAQFLTKEQVKELHVIAHMHTIPVMCYGIRSDFMGEPFPGSSALLVLADVLDELKTVCSRCTKHKATMNPRIDEQGRRILVGDQIGIEGKSHVYAPMCAQCFYEAEAETQNSQNKFQKEV